MTSGVGDTREHDGAPGGEPGAVRAADTRRGADPGRAAHAGAAEAIPPGTADTRREGRGRLGMSIQSKLLAMLLAVSLLAAVIVGVIGFVNGRNSLHAAAEDRVTTLREMRTTLVRAAVGSVEQSVVLNSRNLSAQQASLAFNAGFAEAQTRELSPEKRAELDAFYAERFTPELRERTGDDYSDRAFLPEDPAAQYLQAYYTAPTTDFDAALAVADAGDGSEWSAAHARYHDYFQRLIDTLGYEDILLFNTEGSVVYSAYSGVDLGADITAGPLRDTLLAGAYEEVMATNSVSAVATTDFERWVPSLGVPTMWVVSPVGNDERITGAMAAQVPVERISEVLTGANRWAEQGLGQTGEVYLVGGDGLMRSASRQLFEDPEGYAAEVRANGTPQQTVDRILQVDGTVLLQPVDTEPVARALSGETGVMRSTTITGREAITAYTPVGVSGLDWVAVASVDSDEALAPVREFTRNLVLATLGILLGVTLLSMLFAQVFSRPVRRLAGAVREVAAGDYDTRVPADGRDEFGELGQAFNDMSSSLRIKQDLIDEQREEYDRLLLSVVPQDVATKYRAGEETIAEDHPDVTVVFAQLVGIEDFARGRSSEEERELLNRLMLSFDDAAERTGVEKVRTLHGAYLASSGLIVPRVDNVRRAIDFALELRACVERFNAQHGTHLQVRIGVDTGTVTSGIVSKTGLAYDLWGDAVNLAHRVQERVATPGVYVSQRVRDRLMDSVELDAAGEISAGDGAEPVWKVR